MDRPIVVTQGELHGEPTPTPTPGVTRFEAFANDYVWVGRVENAPHQASDWHVHPGYDTYGHVLRGRFFVEFGPEGAERVEIGPGDFVLIPKGVVHREGNASAEPNDGVIVRVGEGPLTVDLEGPDPSGAEVASLEAQQERVQRQIKHFTATDRLRRDEIHDREVR